MYVSSSWGLEEKDDGAKEMPIKKKKESWNNNRWLL